MCLFVYLFEKISISVSKSIRDIGERKRKGEEKGLFFNNIHEYNQ